jgi:tRNA modification GTPase
MSNHFTKDTIVAIATPPGVGAISVLRISGADAIGAADSIFTGKSKLSDSRSHNIHYGNIVYNNEVIDDVLVSVFHNPNSYTGENAVEINTHGSPLIIKRIIELLILYGVRAAEPGEFTKRAFLNNRIDLAQAEAVADIISARTDASLRGARSQLDGMLSAKVSDLREKLIRISSYIELELDFTEEDIELIQKDEIIRNIDEIILEIKNLLSTYSFGRVIRDGVNVAIVGKPNVGKSSILNYLLKESRAIVSEVPGTTRDIIREEVSIDGILFKLYDTAGIRFSEDVVEKEGVSRSIEAVKIADMVLIIGDTELGFSEEVNDEVSKLNEAGAAIKVLNKIDLNQECKINSDYRISAVTGEGIDLLMAGMTEASLGNSSYSEKDAIVSNIRHYNCLKRASVNLIKAKETTASKLTGEFIAADLRAAESDLGEIIGLVTPDDILNNIFSNFCIGK